MGVNDDRFSDTNLIFTGSGGDLKIGGTAGGTLRLPVTPVIAPKGRRTGLDGFIGIRKEDYFSRLGERVFAVITTTGSDRCLDRTL